MRSDSKGRFTKKSGDYELTIGFPSIKSLILYSFIILVLMQWISIAFKFNILGKVFNLFDILLKP